MGNNRMMMGKMRETEWNEIWSEHNRLWCPCYDYLSILSSCLPLFLLIQLFTLLLPPLIPSCNDFSFIPFWFLEMEFSSTFHVSFTLFILLPLVFSVPLFMNDLTDFFSILSNSLVPKSFIQPLQGFHLQHHRPAFFELNLEDFRVSLHSFSQHNPSFLPLSFSLLFRSKGMDRDGSICEWVKSMVFV